MIGEQDHRNIVSSVRSPRFVAFIDENNPHWRTVVASLTRIFSRTWGGKYFLIVPTNGTRIKDKFWEILEAYRPDYLGTYLFMLADLKEADPASYEAYADSMRKDWKFSPNFNFDEWFNERQYHVPVGSFSTDDALEKRLKDRLAPFLQADHAIHDRLIRNHKMGFPFTEITDINPRAHMPVRKLVLPRTIEDSDLRALILSQTGDLDSTAIEKFDQQGVSAVTLPTDYRTEIMVEALMREWAEGPTDLKLRRAFVDPDQDDPEVPGSDEDFIGHLPFQASMLHLARYYQLGIHRSYQEPVTAVIGDTVEDFCLYYCLSRLHDEVFWLPMKWLDDFDRRRINNRRLRRKGRPTRDYSEVALVANSLVELIYRMTDFGRGEKAIELRSMSLSTDALKRSLAVMDQYPLGSPRGDCTTCQDYSAGCDLYQVRFPGY